MQIAQDKIQVNTFAETPEEKERGNGKKILETGLSIDIANKNMNQEEATKLIKYRRRDKNNHKAQRQQSRRNRKFCSRTRKKTPATVFSRSLPLLFLV